MPEKVYEDSPPLEILIGEESDHPTRRQQPWRHSKRLILHDHVEAEAIASLDQVAIEEWVFLKVGNRVHRYASGSEGGSSDLPVTKVSGNQHSPTPLLYDPSEVFEPLYIRTPYRLVGLHTSEPQRHRGLPGQVSVAPPGDATPPRRLAPWKRHGQMPIDVGPPDPESYATQPPQ